MCFAMKCPCAGPKSRVRRISMSSVPCSSSMRSGSFAMLVVDILPSISIWKVDGLPSQKFAIFFGLLLTADKNCWTAHGDLVRRADRFEDRVPNAASGQIVDQYGRASVDHDSGPVRRDGERRNAEMNISTGRRCADRLAHPREHGRLHRFLRGL